MKTSVLAPAQQLRRKIVYSEKNKNVEIKRQTKAIANRRAARQIQYSIKYIIHTIRLLTVCMQHITRARDKEGHTVNESD